MAKARVQLDEKAIAKHFRSDTVAQGALLKVAEAYKEAAREAAPVGRSTGQFRTIGRRIIIGPFGEPPRGHGFFRSAFHVRPFRGGFRVYNRDEFAHMVE